MLEEWNVIAISTEVNEAVHEMNSGKLQVWIDFQSSGKRNVVWQC